MLPSSHELYYFLEVCQTLNLSRASERLGLSQPSLSNAIKRLEKNIGTALFVRMKNGVKLTKAGVHLYAHASKILSLWETIKSESLASHQEVQGQVTIGCHPSVARYVLPDLLAQVLKEHPRLEITLKHELSRRVVEGVINFSIDVGIVVNPVKHPDLILQKLYDDEVGFWQKDDSSSDSFHDSLTILCDTDLIQTQQLLKKLTTDRDFHYRLVDSPNLDVVASLTAAGCGLGILPRSVALAHDKTLIPVGYTPTYADEIFLVYRAHQRQVKALQIMIQTIRDAYFS